MARVPLDTLGLPACPVIPMNNHPAQPYRAGAAYFALVFSLAFLLGTARLLWVGPALGATRAVLIEVPMILLASWIAAGWLVRRFGLRGARERAMMGVLALVLLFTTEFALALTFFGQSAGQFLGAILTVPGLIGLAGQLGFGAMPMVVGVGRHDNW